MNAIDFVVRTRTGTVKRGSVGGENQDFLIDAGSGNDISLNINQSDLRSYDRAGSDLLITLADGRVIVLEGYFDAGPDGENRLFLSSDGILNEVSFVETDGGSLFAQYGPTETWGKWSPSDELIFLDEPRVVADAYIAGADEDVSMLGAGIGLLGAGGASMAGLAGAAGLAGLAALGGNGSGSGGGGGGGGNNWVAPTVDDPDAELEIGGGDDPSITVTGTANPGSQVDVIIGDTTVTGTAGDDRIWDVVFEGDDFPEDGVYEDVTVIVTDPDGTVTELDGPTFEIDTTPPIIETSEGTVSVGDMFNAVSHEGGVTVSGTGEAGATLTITVGEHSETITVAEGGGWSFTFDETVLPEGEYTVDVTLTSTDSFGNTTTVTDTISIDTVTEVSLTNAPLTGDNLVSDGEYNAGVTLSGTAEAGATVVVEIDGASQTAVAGADGAWSVVFGSGDLAAGTYETTATITSTDIAGNSAVTTHTFNVDTEASLTVETGNVTSDGVVNNTERSDGVQLSGQGEAGAAVAVTVAGTVINTVVGADGIWTITIPTALIPEGETSLAVSATSTDAAGNTATASGSIQIDTETSVSVVTATVEQDGVVNFDEHSDGVTLTGTAQAGAVVEVTLGTVTHTVTAGANGAWSADFSAAEIPTGEQTLDVTAVATDAAGNMATANGSLDVDTLVRDLDITSTPGGADQVVNRAEADQGLTLTGQVEPGSSVVVSLAGASVNAVVAADGSWTAVFSAAQLPSGEDTFTMTATATDAAGNVDQVSQDVRFDTDAGILTISPAPVEGDDIVNYDEASDGVVLTGTSNPGQMVVVTMNGVSHTVQTGANGIWQAPFSAAEVEQGTYLAEITATITDSAGNVLTRTDSVQVDTEVVGFGVSADPVTADNVINNVERGAGVTLTGTTEPGGTVEVIVGGMSRTADVDSNGNWSIVLDSGELPDGETTVDVQIVTVDAVGNEAETTTQLEVDTVVRVLSLDNADGLAGGDNVINAEEAQAGMTLTGQVESGSSVNITFGGMVHAATVAADGSWTVDIPPEAMPTGDGEATIVMEATDAAGNVRVETQTVEYDTEAPGALDWVGYGRDGTGVDELRIETTADPVTISQLVEGATANVVDVDIESQFTIPNGGPTYYNFSEAVSDGTQLVVTSTDAAGNTSGALLVTDDPSSNTVAMSDGIANALSEFQIETIDLHFAEDSELTITEDQITALSSTTDVLVIEGGSDDTVTITGAERAGTATQDGNTYNAFTLGDATVLIDEDVWVNTGVV